MKYKKIKMQNYIIKKVIKKLISFFIKNKSNKF